MESWPPHAGGSKKHGQASMHVCTLGGAAVNTSFTEQDELTGLMKNRVHPSALWKT